MVKDCKDTRSRLEVPCIGLGPFLEYICRKGVPKILGSSKHPFCVETYIHTKQLVEYPGSNFSLASTTHVIQARFYKVSIIIKESSLFSRDKGLISLADQTHKTKTQPDWLINVHKHG